MSKAKIKISAKKTKRGGHGTFLTKVPVRVTSNDNPTSERLYQTRAQVSVRIKNGKGGKPRVR